MADFTADTDGPTIISPWNILAELIMASSCGRSWFWSIGLIE